MSATIMRSNFHSDLLPIINEWHGDDIKMQEDIRSSLGYDMKSSDKSFEVFGVMSGMSTLQNMDENENLSYDDSRESYTPRFNHDKYGLGFKITLEMRQDGRAFAEARRFTKMLSKAVVETKNILAANVLNNGFTSGYTQDGGDGVILFSASHPSIYGNQSNVVTSNPDLSEAAIEAANIQIQNLRDDRGLRINLKPRKILVNHQQAPDLDRILNSSLRVDTANNDLNFIKASGLVPEGYYATPYLTDTDAWYVLTDAMDGLQFFNRYDSPVEMDNVFDNKNACYSKLIRVSQGWINYRAVMASQGS